MDSEHIPPKRAKQKADLVHQVGFFVQMSEILD
jgi:hypothetical protein